MSTTDTLSLAHTARCKLQLAADRPDRNLRFILGHAFTLDKLRLRLMEIETEDSDSDSDIEDSYADKPSERRVSFHAHPHHSPPTIRRASPPPDPEAHLESSSDEEEEEEGEEGDGLELRRFESAAAVPPRMIDDEEGDDEEEDEEREPKSPPALLSEEELKVITQGESDLGLMGAYQHVAGCPCHGNKDAPHVQNMWEVRREGGPRVAVVQVEA